jgi:drug/metabolite transporter (DMT)-like permease
VPSRSARSRTGLLAGLTAAALFGASAPVAKTLLGRVDAQLLAGLLYLGAAAAVIGPAVGRHARHHEAPLRRSDIPRLAGVVVFGGVIAPVLLLLGLERLSGVTGSLLLNLEGPFTAVVGIVVFREYLSRRAWTGALLIFGGATLLSTLGRGAGHVDLLGVTCIIGACAFWALDNNLTQSLSLRDPFAIVAIKAGVAAAVNVTLAVSRGAGIPAASLIAGALLLGAFAYGISVLLDAYALRLLGAAREAAVFATAPFAGAFLAFPVLGESFTSRDGAGAVVILVGLAALLTDAHVHVHRHQLIDHDHRHIHDDHHQHDHEPGVPAVEPHTHRHHHQELVHAHGHASDLHHRHQH